jgi:hypothetical protein
VLAAMCCRLDRGKTAARLITLVRSSHPTFPQVCLQVAHRQICTGKLYWRRTATACALRARSASGDSRAMLDESSTG